MVFEFSPHLAKARSKWEIANDELKIFPKKEMTFGDVQELLNADTKAKMRKAMFRLPGNLFSNDEIEDDHQDEYEAVRLVINHTLSMRYAALSKERLSEETLKKTFGVTVFSSEDERHRDTFLKMQREMTKRTAHQPPSSDRRLASWENARVKPFLASYSFTIWTERYSRWLKRSCENLRWFDCFEIEPSAVSVDVNLGCFEGTPEGIKQCLAFLVDELFSLHMTDVRTVSENGCKEGRISDTAISSIWWL